MKPAQFKHADLKDMTARRKLPPPEVKWRTKPYIYWTTLRPGLSIGYRPTGKPGQPGSWIVRIHKGRTEETYAPIYQQKTIGIADDVQGADHLTFHAATLKATKTADELLKPKAFKPDDAPTVKKVVKEYLAKRENINGKNSYADALSKMEKYLIGRNEKITKKRPAHPEHPLSRLPISQLKPFMIREWRDKVKAESSTSTANRILSDLKAALNYAYEGGKYDDLPSDDAWDRVSPFNKKNNKKDTDTPVSRQDHFSEDQVQALLDSARKSNTGKTNAEKDTLAFADLIEAGFLTGARLGELVQLDVEDFDKKLEQLNIHHGKTGPRTVLLTDDAIQLFKKLSHGRSKGPLLVDALGERWAKGLQHRRMKKALAKADLPATATFYALRHSHISRCLEAGAPVAAVAKNCGTSIAMIEKHYLKLLQARQHDIMRQFAPKLRIKLKAV